ncbi:hypothetical protein CBR_g21745 [Chara braunii]|uniref:RING-type domain-containing protein n=1 Tax=Chara braunii TaxID=69332 RepID=A0A388L1A8_CHABU|nr:hypothetical protein CBR_g21745 [Chara braunii]|eukprot:GBG76085.1 hypothetical protein CBR_g21745 [Chara braunii]
MWQCPSCKHDYDTLKHSPRILPACGHSFCEACLLSTLQNDSVLRCPTDGRISRLGPQGVGGLVRNMSLLEVTNEAHKDQQAVGAPQLRLSLWIDADRLELGEKIGAGDFGEVRLGLLQEGGRSVEVAVKCLFKSSLPTACEIQTESRSEKDTDEAFTKEMEMLFYVSKHCAFVCQLIGICRKDGRLCIIMKKYKCSLRALMEKQGGRLELKPLLRYCTHICRAMAELHKMGVLMRDLKPENFLVDDYDFAVIADFGLSKFLHPRGIGNNTKCMEIAGTPVYMAPEAWGPDSLHKETDAWSFACSVIDMFVGKPPWSHLPDTYSIRTHVVDLEKKPEIPVGLPIEVASALEKCFRYSWRERPSFVELLGIFQHAVEGSGPSSLTAKEGLMLQTKLTMPTPDRILIGSCVRIKRTVNSLVNGWPLGDHAPLMHDCVGILKAFTEDGNALVNFSFQMEPLVLHPAEIEVAPSFREGDFVKIKPSIVKPRYGGWDSVTRQELGTVKVVDQDTGKLLVQFEDKSNNQFADPGEMEIVERPFRKGDWVRMKHSAVKFRTDLKGVSTSSLGIVQAVESDGGKVKKLKVDFCFYQSGVLVADPDEMERIDPPPFCVNDRVRVKATVVEPRFEWGGEGHGSIGPVAEIRGDGLLKVQFYDRSDLWVADPADMEVVCGARAFRPGDWTSVKRSVIEPKYKWGIANKSSIGIVRRVREDGELEVNFCFQANPWLADPGDMVLFDPPPFRVGDLVKVRKTVMEPRYKWGGVTHDSVGPIVRIRDNGSLEVQFPNRAKPWLADPGDMVVVPRTFRKGDWVRVKMSAWKSVEADMAENFKDRQASLGIVQGVENGRVNVSFCCTELPVALEPPFLELVEPEPFRINDQVQVKPEVKVPRYKWHGESHESMGPIIDITESGLLKIQFPHGSGIWLADPADMHVALPARPFHVGDWVAVKRTVMEPRFRWGSVKHSSIGIVQVVREKGVLEVAMCSQMKLWFADPADMALYDPPPFAIGDQVRVKASVKEPRFGWGGETHMSVGPIVNTRQNGCLEVQFYNREDAWLADPADMEVVLRHRPFRRGDWVGIKRTVKKPKYDWENVAKTSIGIVSGVRGDGGVEVEFCFLKRPWFSDAADLALYDPPPFKIGTKVRVRSSVKEPRFHWGGLSHMDIGTVAGVRRNGLLEVQFGSRRELWAGDPADMVAVVEKAQPEESTLKAYRWARTMSANLGSLSDMIRIRNNRLSRFSRNMTTAVVFFLLYWLRGKVLLFLLYVFSLYLIFFR